MQIQLNYVDWRHAKEVNTRNTDAEYLYGELSRRGIPAVIMEPLLGGRLSNVHDHIAAKLRQRRPEQSVASWAFRFAGSFPGVLTVLSGMTYMEHLQDNLRTFSPLDELTDADREFLEETAQALLRYPTIPCNDCKYCMPCPYGLDIPGILLHFNKCINEGRMPSSSRDSAAPFSWAMTAACRACGRPTIASAATNACRTVRRTSTSPRRCSESTASSRTSNRTGNSDGLWNTGHWDERGSA